jgi:hypothetical protein
MLIRLPVNPLAVGADIDALRPQVGIPPEITSADPSRPTEKRGRIGTEKSASIQRDGFDGFQDASASNTASRFLAITARYARVVASGFLRPCSHSCNVLGFRQNARANSA